MKIGGFIGSWLPTGSMSKLQLKFHALFCDSGGTIKRGREIRIKSERKLQRKKLMRRMRTRERKIEKGLN